MAKFKFVLRYDPTRKFFRVGKFLWQRGKVGDGEGYSAKFSFALCPRLFFFYKNYAGWELIVLGIRIHLMRAYGGIIQ
jgi:hypothetical protein